MIWQRIDAASNVAGPRAGSKLGRSWARDKNLSLKIHKIEEIGLVPRCCREIRLALTKNGKEAAGRNEAPAAKKCDPFEFGKSCQLQAWPECPTVQRSVPREPTDASRKRVVLVTIVVQVASAFLLHLSSTGRLFQHLFKVSSSIKYVPTAIEDIDDTGRQLASPTTWQNIQHEDNRTRIAT